MVLSKVAWSGKRWWDEANSHWRRHFHADWQCYFVYLWHCLWKLDLSIDFTWSFLLVTFWHAVFLLATVWLCHAHMDCFTGCAKKLSVGTRGDALRVNGMIKGPWCGQIVCLPSLHLWWHWVSFYLNWLEERSHSTVTVVVCSRHVFISACSFGYHDGFHLLLLFFNLIFSRIFSLVLISLWQNYWGFLHGVFLVFYESMCWWLGCCRSWYESLKEIHLVCPSCWG